MSRVLNYLPRAAMLLAGVALGVIATPRRERSGKDAAGLDELKRSLSGLEGRWRAREAADEERFGQIENRLAEHTAKLADVPSTSQIVAAMEQLLTQTMASLDERLTTQAKSIDVLQTTVSQTDGLLERVLESLDSLQTLTDPVDPMVDPLLDRARARG